MTVVQLQNCNARKIIRKASFWTDSTNLGKLSGKSYHIRRDAYSTQDLKNGK
jgi:hypothetical protein